MNHPESEKEYNELKDTKSLVVVKFSAVWCGPCKAIAPQIDALAEKHNDVVFIHVDVDKLDELKDGSDVRGVPTFKFFKDGELLKAFAGASVEKVKDSIKQYE